MSRENRHCAARAFCWVFLVPRGCQAQTCWKRVCCQCKRTFFTIPPPPKKRCFPHSLGWQNSAATSHLPPLGEAGWRWQRLGVEQLMESRAFFLAPGWIICSA